MTLCRVHVFTCFPPEVQFESHSFLVYSIATQIETEKSNKKKQQ